MNNSRSKRLTSTTGSYLLVLAATIVGTINYRAKWLSAFVTVTLMICLALPVAFADETAQQTFQTPEAAGSALVAARTG
jgi:hypothetical protein